MRVEALALLCSLLGACAGANLVVGDGPAAGSGAQTSPDGSGFEPPRVIAELESEDVSDDDPSLTADLLDLCFNSKRKTGMGQEDIWCCHRAHSDEAWGTPEPTTQLNTKHRETGIALALDGLSVWFSSDRDGDAGGLDVYTATRPTRDSAWSPPTRVPELSSQDDDLVSSIDETEQRLMLARRTRGKSDDEGHYSIYIAERSTPSAAWQAPTPVSELNTDDGESDAFLVGRGLEMLFSRNSDLMLARRSRLTEPFGHIEPMRVLNSDKHERDAWSNSEFTYIVFSSDRAGSYRLYESRRDH